LTILAALVLVVVTIISNPSQQEELGGRTQADSGKQRDGRALMSREKTQSFYGPPRQRPG
jgi:hypothetical protein